MYKNKENAKILHDICPKIPEFYVTFSRKIFFPDFLGAGWQMRPSPSSTPIFMIKNAPHADTNCTVQYDVVYISLLVHSVIPVILST